MELISFSCEYYDNMYLSYPVCESRFVADSITYDSNNRIETLENELPNNAPIDHTHTMSDITDYTSPDLSNYATTDHTHTSSDITDYEPIDLPSKADVDH